MSIILDKAVRKQFSAFCHFCLSRKKYGRPHFHHKFQIQWRHWHAFRRDLLKIYCWTLKLSCISSREDTLFLFSEELWASKEVISHSQSWPELGLLYMMDPRAQTWKMRHLFVIYSLSFKLQESEEWMKSQMMEQLWDK